MGYVLSSLLIAALALLYLKYAIAVRRDMQADWKRLDWDVKVWAVTITPLWDMAIDLLIVSDRLLWKPHKK